MKHTFVTFLFLLLSVSSYAQKIDSLYLENIYEKIIELNNNVKLDSAIYYANTLLQKAKVANNRYFELKAYNKLAYYHKKNNSPFEAVRYYTKSKELNILLGDTTNAINKLRYIASIQKRLGDYYSSENTAIEALMLSELLNDSIDSKHRLALYNHLGIITKNQHNYSDAKNWYKKALFLLKKDSIKIAAVKSNIAVVNIKQGNFEKAINILNKVLTNNGFGEKTKQKARAMDNLAYAKSKLNDSEAEKELIQAFRYRKKINDVSGQFASNIHLTEHYQDRKQYGKALIYANNAYQIAKTLQSGTSKVEALSYLIKLKDNPKTEAIEFERLNDSINIARQRAKNQFAKIKYETDQYREENLIMKAKNAQQQVILQKQKYQRVILVSLVLLLCIGIGFVFNYLKQRNKVERIKERHSTENRLSKKLHDEVGNDIFYLANQLQQDPHFITDPDKLKILKGFDNVYHKVRNISRDHKVETGDEYGDELLSLLNSYGDQTTKVITNTLDNDFWSSVTAYKKVELYHIIKELLTNMKKHSKANFASITFTKEKQLIVVSYIDNGVGISSKQPITKNGLLNVENRMEEIGGTITFESEPEQGFKAKIVFTS
ncbi:tetratricopeptide repeat-containing sensor histidine kinase [Aquimarina sediminis]|uniref:tetratricopeptide repeat-containing sensor histidine kinase n=1 Tax=Aquimarina sediminis TaxID=2070536 RepID=UPI000CA01A89|nr:ATP-binding protein [Aquimarina sediminis]